MSPTLALAGVIAIVIGVLGGIVWIQDGRLADTEAALTSAEVRVADATALLDAERAATARLNDALAARDRTLADLRRSNAKALASIQGARGTDRDRPASDLIQGYAGAVRGQP